MPGPFDGLRVLELGRFIAVPFCGQLLAEGGADVIKVEDLDGDQTRHNGPITPTEGRQYFNKNRGKRSIAVKLGDPTVRSALQSLAQRADIVLANFRPGLAVQLGLDYESIRARNPKVIYAENTAFGLEGELAGMPGMDVVLQGMTGLAHFGADGPQQIEGPIIDHTAALIMAFGVSTALYHRERTGTGQKLDVALMHAAMVLENTQLTHVDIVDSWRVEFLAYLKTAFAQGKTWAEVLNVHDQMNPRKVMKAYYGFFETSDGAVAVACNARSLRARMAACMGVEDRWSTEKDWLPDDAAEHEQQVREQVVRRFRVATTEHWINEFRNHGLPIGPVRHTDEMFNDRQAWDNGFLAKIHHDVVGDVTIVAPPLKMSATPFQVLPTATLGKHSREVLAEAGLASAEIDRLFAEGVIREVHETLADLY
ncbi:MAG: CaiB/BaiF CoA transferase family protein [Dehalococcoidia bacterium]